MWLVHPIRDSQRGSWTLTRRVFIGWKRLMLLPVQGKFLQKSNHESMTRNGDVEGLFYLPSRLCWYCNMLHHACFNLGFLVTKFLGRRGRGMCYGTCEEFLQGRVENEPAYLDWGRGSQVVGWCLGPCFMWLLSSDLITDHVFNTFMSLKHLDWMAWFRLPMFISSCSQNFTGFACSLFG